MSHEEQTDLRIRRTQKFLQEAMIELITEKGFDASRWAIFSSSARGERSWKQRIEHTRTKPTSHLRRTSMLRLVGEKTGARREHLPSGA
jgi:hypothetical protein